MNTVSDSAPSTLAIEYASAAAIRDIERYELHSQQLPY